MQSNRKFQIWEYCVSHSWLVIRSLGNPYASPTETTHNIDLNFAVVKYVAIPSVMRGLELVPPTDEECRRIVDVLGGPLDPEMQVFVLASQGRRHLVVAGNLTISENDLPLNKTLVDCAPMPPSGETKIGQ